MVKWALAQPWVQFTKFWLSALRFRRFGMDAELCGCAELGDRSKHEHDNEKSNDRKQYDGTDDR